MLVVGALAVLAGASVARNRHQTGRAAASRSALHALRVHSRSGPEIVFALRSPVPAGTVVRDGGPARPGSAGRARHSSTRVVARTKGRAWFFYEDLAPFREYAHAGRVVVVDVSSGRVTVSRRLSWPPTLNGRLPVFLASQTAYLSSRYRVFYRPYVGVAAVASRLSSRMSAPGVRRVPAALDPTRGAEVAALLASEHACVVRFSDTVPGGYYAFAHIAQSRGALAFRFSQLANFARGFQSFIYSRTSGVSATAFVTSLISSHGCRDVMLYMAGGGYPGTGAVNIGMGISASDALHQDVTAAALRGLVGANPGVDFELVLDAPYTAAFQSLERIENVLLVASAVAPDGGSFTYLPEARVGGRLVSNHTNPLHVLQLTDRLAFGLDRVIDRRAEVAQLVSLNRLGKLPSVLAYVVARAFALGGPVDFVARTGVGSAPSVHFHGFTAGPPSGGGGPPPVVPPVVTARPDSYTVALPGPLSVTAVDGVLANDSDSAGNVLRVDKLNGTGLAPPLHGTSAKGAAVTLNEDGSFTYDPAGVAALQGAHGQSVTDTFSYRATDRKGGLATATVSITVSGVNHPPVAVDDTASTANDAKLTGPSVLANDTDADGDKLTVDQLNGSSSLSGTSAKGAAVTLNSDGTYSYDPTGSATLQAIPRGQTTTDTFTYRASDGHGGTATATVTVTVVGVANHPPVANPDSYAVDNGVLLTVSSASSGVLANDTDPDLDSLTIDRLNGTGGTAPFTSTSAKGAAVTLNSDGSFAYDPTGSATLQAVPRGQTTTDTFTYRVSDGHGGTTTTTVTITVTGAVNHPPIATPDAYAVTNNAAFHQDAAGGVLANDTDLDRDTLSVDQLNGAGGTAPFTATTGKGATIALNADGSFSYDPTGSATLQAIPRGQTTTDTFTYRANDGHGGTATATVTITVTGAVNHLPVAIADAYAANNDAVLSQGPASGVLANDTDADADTLTVDQLNGAGGTAPFSATTGKGATITLNADGSFSYDPTGSATLQAIPRGQTTTDTFTYRASDGHGGTATATVTVTVVGVANHPPVANPDSYAVDNGVLLTVSSASSGVLANDTDPDLDSLTIDRLNGTGGTAPFTGTSAKGATVKLNADGTFTYDPTNAAPLHPPNLAIGQSTADTFTYGVNDGHGGTATGTVTVTVTAVDTPPTANDFTVATNVVGNTLIEVGTQPSPSSEPKTTDATSLAAHSSDPDIPFGDSLTFSAPAISTSGGNVSVTNSSAGAFTYRSAPGFTGTDTFTYTATDSFGKSATGQVTLHVSRMVWYVQNNAPGPHDGRSGSPFSTLASAESATGSAAGDFIYVFKGDGTTTGQNSGITLKNNQTLLSEKYNLVVGSQTLATGNPTNRPAIGNGAGDGITLAAGDTVTGFDITGTGGGHFAIAGGSGDASGAIADDILHGTGSAGGLTLNGTSGTWSVSDLTATGTGGAAFDANAAGTVTFTGTNSLTGSAAGAFKNASATTYSGTIGTTSSTGGTADGIDASGASGSITFDGGTLSGTTSNAILASGGNANVTYSGTETNTAGHSVNVNARTGGTISIQSPINDTGTGITIANNTAGTTTINGAGKTINTGTSPAISITGNTAQTVNITGGGLNVNTTSGDGVNISGPAAVTLSGGSDTIDSTSGTALHISGASAGTITSDAQINGSATNTGHSIDISGHTGGAITQTGNITDHGTGLTMTNNTGATVSLTGAITASTGASTAFNATGGGTITATAPASTLTTTTGTALNVQNTTIGASGLTFRSLTAGTATGSSGDGIVLDTTGSNGGLTITGNSSGTCGGSVSGTTPSLAVTAPSSADCTGGVIQHKTGADGSTTSGIGIYLNNTANVSLNRMSLHDFDNFGILGSGVSGLAISNSQFTGSNGTSQTGSGEGAAYFSGLSGSTSVTNSFFSGGALDSFHLENNVNQVLNRITFSGDNFGDTLNATSGSALFMQADCTAQLNMTVNTSVFTAARSNNLNVSIRGQSTDDLAVSNSQFSNSDPNQVSGGSNLAVAAGGPGSGCADNTLNPALTYNIHDNTFRDALGTAISISKGGVGTGTFGTTANPGTIDHNTIGVSGNSTSSGAGGIGSILVGGGRITTNITNNAIHGAINGISVGANSSVAGGGQGTYDAEIQGNTIDTPNVGAGNVTNGLLAQFGSVATDNPKACLTLGASAAASKNSLDGGRNGGADLRLRVRFGTLIGILGYAGANNDDTAMTNFLSGQNTIGTGGVVVTNNASTGSGWTGSCPA
jgi:VCBS repeat-containing protein